MEKEAYLMVMGEMGSKAAHRRRDTPGLVASRSVGHGVGENVGEEETYGS